MSVIAGIGFGVLIGSILLLLLWILSARYSRRAAVVAYSLLSLAAVGGMVGVVFGVLAGAA